MCGVGGRTAALTGGMLTAGTAAARRGASTDSGGDVDRHGGHEAAHPGPGATPSVRT
ncbi:hypothetical protein Spla01_04347 [Streptomyces platensis]|uniref:Uncharacterized protein n=1 Tax=Streptomyces platensis TaxID=58346 RepID=A0ABX3XU99_STRPT|nr:hypothetical protein BG653_04168 [Streptomyces platensis]